MRERTHRPYWSVPSGYSAQGAKKDCVITVSYTHLDVYKRQFQDALKAYARRKGKDLRTLVRYAKLFRVEKILRQYLEVLL